VSLRLLEVLFPFILQLLIHDATKSGLIDLNAAHLGLERLVQKLVKLLIVH
jgi:hypothetical protein